MEDHPVIKLARRRARARRQAAEGDLDSHGGNGHGPATPSKVTTPPLLGLLYTTYACPRIVCVCVCVLCLCFFPLVRVGRQARFC